MSTEASTIGAHGASTAPTAATALPDLERPLPDELTGRAHGWFTRYRRYPVFSAHWARARTRAWIVPAGLFLLSVGGGSFWASTEGWPWAAVFGIAASILLPLLAGPWLGVWVRRRGWPPRREGLGLLAAMVLLVATMLLIERHVAEPVKQTVAQWLGDVDERGQRRRIALQIGVTVQPMDRIASAPAAAPEQPPEPTAPFNLTVRAVLAFWLGGGFALVGWRREREGLARLAAERELAQARAARREAEMRLAVLAAQVEPHFLFNTLAGVRSAIASDPERASRMIDRLVDYLRASIPRLRSDGSAEATVGAQFEVVRAYLGLMAARMPRLGFEVDLPADLRGAHCPPLMLISLAENAVKHGVEMKVGPARVEVSARRGGDGRLLLTVADDGVGFGAAPSGSGLGLANIRERLRQLYGDRAALTLSASPGGGVAAVLELPLEFAGRAV